MSDHLSSDADDTASGTAASVAGGERVGVAALAEVVGTGVDDDRAADDRVGADERDLLVLRGCQRPFLTLRASATLTGDVDVDVARAVSLDVAEVADVTLSVRRTSVVLSMRVEMRPRRRTTVGVVSKSVDTGAVSDAETRNDGDER